MEALGRYLELISQDPGFLFCHMGGSSLTRHQFWTVMSQALDTSGLCSLRFGTHSYRTWVVSMVAAIRFGASQIRQIGRWWSAAFKSYVQSVKLM